MELLGKTNIDFIGKRNISFVISAIISIIGIIGIIQIGRGAANMGIDFSGGTSMQLKFSKPIPIADARAALHKNGIAKADLQEIKDGNKLLVKMAGAAVGKPSEMVQTAFKKEFAGQCLYRGKFYRNRSFDWRQAAQGHPDCSIALTAGDYSVYCLAF